MSDLEATIISSSRSPLARSPPVRSFQSQYQPQQTRRSSSPRQQQISSFSNSYQKNYLRSYAMRYGVTSDTESSSTYNHQVDSKLGHQNMTPTRSGNLSLDDLKTDLKTDDPEHSLNSTSSRQLRQSYLEMPRDDDEEVPDSPLVVSRRTWQEKSNHNSTKVLNEGTSQLLIPSHSEFVLRDSAVDDNEENVEENKHNDGGLSSPEDNLATSRPWIASHHSLKGSTFESSYPRLDHSNNNHISSYMDDVDDLDEESSMTMVRSPHNATVTGFTPHQATDYDVDDDDVGDVEPENASVSVPSQPVFNNESLRETVFSSSSSQFKQHSANVEVQSVTTVEQSTAPARTQTHMDAISLVERLLDETALLQQDLCAVDEHVFEMVSTPQEIGRSVVNGERSEPSVSQQTASSDTAHQEAQFFRSETKRMAAQIAEDTKKFAEKQAVLVGQAG